MSSSPSEPSSPSGSAVAPSGSAVAPAGCRRARPGRVEPSPGEAPTQNATHRERSRERSRHSGADQRQVAWQLFARYLRGFGLRPLTTSPTTGDAIAPGRSPGGRDSQDTPPIVPHPPSARSRTFFSAEQRQVACSPSARDQPRIRDHCRSRRAPAHVGRDRTGDTAPVGRAPHSCPILPAPGRARSSAQSSARSLAALRRGTCHRFAPTTAHSKPQPTSAAIAPGTQPTRTATPGRDPHSCAIRPAQGREQLRR